MAELVGTCDGVPPGAVDVSVAAVAGRLGVTEAPRLREPFGGPRPDGPGPAIGLCSGGSGPARQERSWCRRGPRSCAASENADLGRVVARFSTVTKASTMPVHAS